MVDRIFQTAKTLINTDGRGNFKPSDFDLVLFNVINEKYEEYFFDVNRLINRENRGVISSGLDNITDVLRENITHYLKHQPLVYQDSYFLLPDDLKYIDSLLYKKNRIELCKDFVSFNAITIFRHTQPDTTYPVGLKEGNAIKVAPDSIQFDVTVYYLRQLLMSKWTFFKLSGAELFNPSAPDFQDVDMHPSEEADIILRVLAKFGINLKETDLQNSTATKEAQDFNKENTL